MSKPRIKIPDSAKAGELIEIKTLISHVMETGQRKDAEGKLIPRNVIHTFTATFSGKEVFRADMSSGVSANPYIAFYMLVPGPGEFEFTWIDDKGIKIVEKLPLNVA